MKSARATLPELDLLMPHEIAAPMRRPRYLIGKSSFNLSHHCFERRPAGKGARLLTGPGTDLAIAWPGGEISIGLGIRQMLNLTNNANLPLKIVPDQAEARPLGGIESTAFITQAVGEKGEASVIETA